MDGFMVRGGGDDGGDDVRCSCPTADSSSNQNAGEQDGGEEKMTKVFGRCERATGDVWFARARVERDVLDVTMV